jgi:DNA oxidative demethylase
MPDQLTFRHLPAHLNAVAQLTLLNEIRAVIRVAPLFTPTMPRTGKPFSVRMGNCGSLGWVSDKAGGYRYQATHPVTGAPWPPMPESLLRLWREVTGYAGLPEACLINVYGAGTKMGSHVDADEADKAAPVLSVSLGDAATFHVGGVKRSDPKVRVRLSSGDVLVLEGASRHAYHGIDRVFAGTSTLLADDPLLGEAALLGHSGRINLTLRRVTV